MPATARARCERDQSRACAAYPNGAGTRRGIPGVACAARIERIVPSFTFRCCPYGAPRILDSALLDCGARGTRKRVK